MSVLAWITAAVAGWFWVRALFPRAAGQPAWIRHGTEAALSVAFGAGAAATVFFALLWSGLRPPNAAWAADALVLAGGVLAWLMRRRRGDAMPPPEPAAPLPWAWMAALAATGCLIAFLAATVIYLRANPQGDWDAWAIWNARAKFLAHEGMWRNAISPELTETHPEYPLLWSAAVARAWVESGSLEQAAPQAGALLTSLALVGLFACSLAAIAGRQWMSAGLACLFMTTPLWRMAPSQYADVPLALFLLAATVAAAAAGRARWSASALALSGALASFAAFTKNEGLAFCVFLGATLAAVARTRALWWLVGAMPGLVLTALFHALLAPPKAILNPAAFLSFGRFADTLAGFGAALWKLGEFPAHPLLFAAVLFFVFRPQRPYAPLWPVAPALLLLGADFAVIWGSTSAADWQARTAADRLLLHAVPVLLLYVFVWLSSSTQENGQQTVASKTSVR